ncbi:GMC family oxidoreductase [Rhodococcoides fascians]|uniref:GMC family oxidoreductase n=1 Tax=Rhodococcoides fascians TaxID=1828 RepID=UPI00050C92AC|nr:GMC family oxidoreductase N-terminal domain-containing protein [Rhodococcus fascians]
MRTDRYDYVIAGGGTAGCVLAGRLSEDSSVRVLLLEAGASDRHPFIHVPAGFAKLTSGKYDWGLHSVPQTNCDNRVIPLAQGKVLGGGGSINAQVFTRGAHEDYDVWAEEYGCSGWSFADIQKYFVQSESNERLAAPHHGVDGPLSVSDPVNPHPLSKAFVQAGQEFGLPFNGDFNGPSQLGVGMYQTTTMNSRRCSAAVAYIKPARKRSNLTIRTDVLVSKILLEGKRATGIEFITANGVEQVRADREVLVTSGAYGSPKLLQLSGIGHPDDLAEAGVQVRHPLEGVGRNLQDHCDLDVIYELRDYQSLDRLNLVRPATALAGLDYILSRRGPLASTVVEAGAFSFGHAKEECPDLQFHFLPAAGVEAGVVAVRPGYGCTLNSYSLRPTSRGSIRIKSADPREMPLIDPNYLGTDFDLESSIEGLKQSREIMAQPAMAKYIKAEHLGGGRSVRTKDDYISFVRSYGRTSYHPVGTCAMGMGDGAVVSPSLKVLGLDGLRVIDSSVMPQIVSSNTQAPTVMIAEKAVDLIRAGD